MTHRPQLLLPSSRVPQATLFYMLCYRIVQPGDRVFPQQLLGAPAISPCGEQGAGGDNVPGKLDRGATQPPSTSQLDRDTLTGAHIASIPEQVLDLNTDRQDPTFPLGLLMPLQFSFCLSHTNPGHGTS